MANIIVAGRRVSLIGSQQKRNLTLNSSIPTGPMAEGPTLLPLNGPPWRDDEGRSPWVGRFRHYDEYLQAKMPNWDEPFLIKPDEDVLIDGINGVEGIRTQFRLGRELWIDATEFKGWDTDLRRLRNEYLWPNGSGFLYREALSCMSTTLNARMRAALQFLKEVERVDQHAKMYITEQVTPMFDFVADRYTNLVGSEFLPDVARGETRDGIRCEDLTCLTFDDGEFDCVLSFDVLEHVFDYKAALRELARVLKPGGLLLMTAPMSLLAYKSTARAHD